MTRGSKKLRSRGPFRTRTLVLAACGIVAIGAVAIAAVIAGGNSDGSPPVADSSLVTEDSWKITSADATVTIVEFLDFECEACGAAHPVVQQILDDYKGRVNYVVRNFPNHNNSVLAATAAEAAGEQGKYWEMFNALFEKQGEWGEKREPQTEAFISYARDIGLDIDAFTAALSSGKYDDKIAKDRAEGIAVGVDATPTFFINGKKSVGVLSYGAFAAALDAELAK